MNKISMIVLPVVLVLFGASVYAQDAVPSAASNNNSAEMQRLMKARYGSSGGRMGMMPPMMSKEKIEKIMQSFLEMGLLYKMLEQPTMVSTDSGVIVAYGNTLRKYDKDLNVVKEVDLDVNVEGMQELAGKFAKKYTTDLMDLMGQGAPGDASATPSASPSDPSSVSPGVAPAASAGTIAANSNSSFNDQKEAEIKKEIDQMK